jgi:hypothetical protein
MRSGSFLGRPEVAGIGFSFSRTSGWGHIHTGIDGGQMVIYFENVGSRWSNWIVDGHFG